MKKVSLLSAVILATGMLFLSQAKAQGRIELGAAKSAQQCIDNNRQGFTATFSFGSIEAVNINTAKGEFSSLLMDNTYPFGAIGVPSLPAANKLIAIPFGATDVSVKVKGYTTTIYNLADYGIKTIAPQQPPVCKEQKPEDIPFAYDEKAYHTRGYQELPIATFSILGTMRGIQVAALSINPVAYDVVNNTIKVYNDIEVEVSYGRYDETAAYNEFARTFSPYFAGIYRQMFNWRDDVYDQHPDLWQTPVKMLVIADPMFETKLQDWISWKTTKGFYMDVNYTDQIGTSAAAIKSFIQTKYNNHQTAPTFLVIIGDNGQVPASDIHTSPFTADGLHYYPTDLYYASTDGDEFPEMFHSRMSAESATDLANILEKSLEYEQYTKLDRSYLDNALLVAGRDDKDILDELTGFPAIWYASNYYFNQAHGLENVYEYSHNEDDYTGCFNYLNSGVGFVNYSGHGFYHGWGEQDFRIHQAEALTNEHKYFLAMGNCCLAADWGWSGWCFSNYYTCSFGETMIRLPKKGAFAYIGASSYTYWANDYFFQVGATGHADNTMPTYEETTMGAYDAIWDDNAYNTISAIPFIGNLASSYANANPGIIPQYFVDIEEFINPTYCWEIYHVLGDGSIMPYRTQPTANSISHMAILPIGASTYNVSAEPGSYVALSKDGVLLTTGLVGETGTLELEIEPFTSCCDVTLCITKSQRIPSVETIPVAPITFTGSENDHEWSTASNWNSKSIPTATDNVIIDGECEINQDVAIASITVKSGAKLSVANNMTLTTTSPLLLEDGAELVAESNNIQATVQKDITGFGTSNSYWYLIASPVTNNTTVTNLTANDYDLYTFDATKALEWRNQHDNPVINHKTGYLYASDESTTLEFTGTLAGTTEATVLTFGEYDTDYRGFNLIGNPYPCKTYIDESYYRTNDNGDGLIVGVDAIEPCEAIFVKADTDGQTITFSKTPNYLSFASLTLSNGRGNVTDGVLVRFDDSHNLEKFMSLDEKTKLYISHDGKELAVISTNGNNLSTIPICLKVMEEGTYTIHFEVENATAQYMHLIDNMTGADIDILGTSPSYTFEAKPSDYASRFKLVFNATGVDENNATTSSASFAYLNNGNLVIDQIEGEATLQIIDMTGRIISTEMIKGSYNKALNLLSGIYVLKMNEMTQRIVVK